MATMSDWKKVLQGKEDIDKSNFETFIPRNGDDDFLQEAFGKIPNGNFLINKIKILLKENNNEGWYVIPSKENCLPELKLKEYLYSYCENVSRFLESAGYSELAAEAKQRNIKIVYDNKVFFDADEREKYTYSGIEDELSNLVGGKLAIAGNFSYCLEESLLFLTKCDGVTRYLLQEVIGFSLDSRPYYELWRAGGDVAFFGDCILMLCEHGPS